MSEKLKINAVYNGIYQFILIGLPLVIAPYASRVLGATSIGQISFAQAVFVYFNLLSAMGSGTYGQRLIASVKDDSTALAKCFWEIVILKIFLGCLGVVFFLGFTAVSQFPFKILLYAQIVDLSVNMVDIAWLYQGLEDFKKTVSRQVLIKIVSAASVFVFVKEANDTFQYLLCFSVPTLIGYLAMWPGFRAKVIYIPIRELAPFRHFRGLVALFIPYIAVLLFSYIDKLMLGLLVKDTSVLGYFEQAMKFITISLGVVTSLSVVLMPAISSLHSNDEKEKLKSILLNTIRFSISTTLIIFLILFVSGQNFIPWFLGSGFVSSVPILKILSGLVVFKGINSILGMGYLVATYQQSKYTIAISVSAIANVLLDFLFIPYFQAVGAAYASLISEVIFFVYLVYVSKSLFSYLEYLKLSWKYISSAIFVVGLTYYPGSLINPTVLNSIGFVVVLVLSYYSVVTYFFKDEFLKKNLQKIILKVVR